MCTVAALSSNLEDALGSTAKVTLQAIGAQEAALQAIAQHTRQLREAMEAEVRKGHIFKNNSNWGDFSKDFSLVLHSRSVANLCFVTLKLKKASVSEKRKGQGYTF